MKHDITIREKLAQYGFSCKPLTEEAEKARHCPKCNHPKVEDALDLPVCDEAYDVECMLYEDVFNLDPFKEARRAARILLNIEDAVKRKNSEGLARVDEAGTFFIVEENSALRHESGMKFEDALEKLIQAKLQTMLRRTKNLKGKVLLRLPHQSSKSYRRISNARYGWSGKHLVILAKAKGDMFYGFECETLKSTDTIETLEMTETFLENMSDLKTAIGAARTV